eukprot:s906_g10.t1
MEFEYAVGSMCCIGGRREKWYGLLGNSPQIKEELDKPSCPGHSGLLGYGARRDASGRVIYDTEEEAEYPSGWCEAYARGLRRAIEEEGRHLETAYEGRKSWVMQELQESTSRLQEETTARLMAVDIVRMEKAMLPGKEEAHLKELLSRLTIRGTEVKLCLQENDVGEVPYPAYRWLFHKVFSFKWQDEEIHINEGELNAFLAMAERRASDRAKHASRYLAILDSQVVRSAIGKGRSPSRPINRGLRRSYVDDGTLTLARQHWFSLAVEVMLGGLEGPWLSGTFAPQELLTRPKFLHYVQFLQEAKALGEMRPDDAKEIGLGTAEDAEDAVQLLHRAAAAGSTTLIDFLIGRGLAPVDGHCSNKRLKAGCSLSLSLPSDQRRERERVAMAHLEGTWIVIGGADKGGILVRESEELSSESLEERLEYGALLQEEELKGSRLRYRKIYGKGPEIGWISTKIHGKELVTRVMPPHLTRLQGARGHALQLGEPELTFFAISDVHVELKENMQWLNNLPSVPNSCIIVAGDLGVSLAQVRHALQVFKQKFTYVFYCYGNHETWCHKSVGDEDYRPVADSFDKLELLRDICIQEEIFVSPQLLHNVWVVPVLGWYHRSWDTEPPLQAPPGQELRHPPLPGEKFATDTGACKWRGFANASTELAESLDRQNELWGIWPLPLALEENLKQPRGERKSWVISFSHFLPELELMPEKRFLFTPNLTHIVGSSFIRKRPADISGVWKTWINEPAVRSTAIDHGCLIVSHLGAGHALRTCIKDAVRNKYSLTPCLKIMAQTEDFKLFGVKDAQREPLAFAKGYRILQACTLTKQELGSPAL